MIFLTLGTQLGFDRLVQEVDQAASSLDEAIFGQIGNSNYKPRNFKSVDSLSPQDFDMKFTSARVIIGHAGIGTILSGLKAEKPLVLMARQAKYGEHRNDHQLATVAQLKALPGIYIVENWQEIQELLRSTNLRSMRNEGFSRRAMLIDNLRSEITRPKVARK